MILKQKVKQDYWSNDFNHRKAVKFLTGAAMEIVSQNLAFEQYFYYFSNWLWGLALAFRDNPSNFQLIWNLKVPVHYLSAHININFLRYDFLPLSKCGEGEENSLSSSEKHPFQHDIFIDEKWKSIRIFGLLKEKHLLETMSFNIAVYCTHTLAPQVCMDNLASKPRYNSSVVCTTYEDSIRSKFKLACSNLNSYCIRIKKQFK